MRIGDAIDRILARMPERLAEPGCDRVVHGDPGQELRGVAVTFMASAAVAERAAAAGANLIVTHERTWWNHHDHVDWLDGDAVLAAKRARLDAAGLVLWRLHDHLHRGWPDLIAAGVLAALGWERYADPARFAIVAPPPATLGGVAAHARARLGAATLRVAGDPAMAVRRLALLPGAWGGRRQIELLRQDGVDAVLCGESPEWETCEYVRDACACGRPKGLIVAGHAASEEAGMAHLAGLVRGWLPGVPVAHLATGEPFTR